MNLTEEQLRRIAKGTTRSIVQTAVNQIVNGNNGSVQKAKEADRAREADHAKSAATLDENSAVWDQLKGEYLSKIHPDVAQEIITFLKGIKIGDLFGFDKDGNIVAYSVTSNDFDEDERKGFAIRKDAATVIVEPKEGDGGYSLYLDNITAWVKATLGALHVKGSSVFDGELSSPDFVSGFLDGKGWRIRGEGVENAAGVQEQRYTGEIDNLVVRGTLRVFEMVISQLLGENDNRVFTGMLEVDHYDAESGKVYLDTKDGRYYNPFRKDDCIMVQQYNGMPSDENDHYVTKRYELVVTEAGSEGEGENMLAWVKFRNFTSTMEGATPESLIRKKDTFVRVDNLSDPGRKGIITITTVGSDTPYIDVIYGLKTDPNGAMKGRMGNLQGIRHPLFGDLQGFGEYLCNLYAIGDIILRRTGENIDTKFQILENLFSSGYSRTQYDLTDDANYLHNGQLLASVGESGDDGQDIIDGWTVEATDETAFYIDDDGMPVMVNGYATSGGDRQVKIESSAGRQVLRIANCGITQGNSLIDQPKTHREYSAPTGKDKTTTNSDGTTSTGMKEAADGSYKDVQDTLYVNLRIYVLASGDLTLGFEGCEAVDGKDNGLTAKTQTLQYSGEWQTVKMEGRWNGTGSFTVRFTGDCKVAFVSVTDKPLDNLQATYSTAIQQTAEAIRLLGENDDRLNGRYTTLGVNIDAQNKKIETWVSEADNKYAAKANLDTLQKKVDTLSGNNYYTQSNNPWQSWTSGTEILHIGDKWKYTGSDITDGSLGLVNGHVYRYDYYTMDGSGNSRYAWTDITDITSAASYVRQTKDSIDAAVANFDADGNVRESSYAHFSPVVNKVISESLDADTKKTLQSGMMTTSTFSQIFTDALNSDGSVAKSASIGTFVTKNGDDYITNAKIKADRIDLEGYISANKTFTVDTSGFFEATGGKIGGFTINTNYIGNKGSIGSFGVVSGKNAMWLTDEMVGFNGRSGDERQAAVGIISNVGNTYLGSFLDKNYRYGGENIGLWVDIENKGGYSNAIQLGGGYISGFALKTSTMSGGGTIPRDVNVVRITGTGTYTLPTMYPWDDGHVLMLTMAASVTVTIAAGSTVAYSGSSSSGTWYSSHVVHDSGSTDSSFKFESPGNGMTLVYFFGTSGGTWHQFKMSRNW